MLVIHKQYSEEAFKISGCCQGAFIGGGGLTPLKTYVIKTYVITNVVMTGVMFWAIRNFPLSPVYQNCLCTVLYDLQLPEIIKERRCEEYFSLTYSWS